MKRIFSNLLVTLAMILFLIEEWLWEVLKAVTRQIARLPFLAALERALGRLPPAGAAVVFAIPVILLVPFKFAALALIARGHASTGVAIFVAAKLFGTAMYARIYAATKPALMTLGWFVRIHSTLLRWRVWAHAQLEAQPLWRALRRRVLRWRARVEQWRTRGNDGRWMRRWHAAQRLDRMRRRV